MASSAQRKHAITSEEYLQRELASPVRHELVQGTLYAMGGASDRHNIIALNFVNALLNHLPERCQVFSTDMKLKVRRARAEEFYYPDLMVSCAADDREPYFRERPILLGEVLSPTTERIDRTQKFDAYRQIAELEEYVLADQEQMRVEVYRRRSGWEPEVFGAGDGFALSSVDLTMTVAQVYRRVTFGAG